MCVTFRLLYLERTFHHFLKVELGGTFSDAVNQLFSTLLNPGLPSYGFGILLLEVSVISVPAFSISIGM